MRKEIDITITSEGRDKGKVFHIKEKSAVEAERWALRVLRGIAKSGADLPMLDPESLQNGGMQMLFMIGLQAAISLEFEESEILMDEMLQCVSVKPSPNIERPLLPEDDIEEVSTLIWLRKEVLDLHMGFSKSDGQSTSA